MEQRENRIHFRKTLYFKMIMVIFFLSIVFFIALFSIYKVSRKQFEDELTSYSDILTEQICQNVETTLRALSEKIIPLTTTNEYLSPFLYKVTENMQDPDPPYLGLHVKKQLDDLLGMNYSINWIAVVDRKGRVYQSSRDSRIRGAVPDMHEVQSLYRANQENLGDRYGNTVWVQGINPGGIILMRSIFDSDTMTFCGTIISEVENSDLKQIFASIDREWIGDFTIYDRNGIVLYSTCSSETENLNEQETMDRIQNGSLLQTEYEIHNGKMRIVHSVDMEEKNRRFSELLYLIAVTGLIAFAAATAVLWMMFGNMAKNMKILLDNIDRISRGEFELEPAMFAKGEELDILVLNIQEMALRIKKLMRQVVQDKEVQEQNRYKLLETRYHALQSQVNPHFLFNILQSINGIAQINGDRQVSRLICMLSKFFRGSIDRRYVSCELGEELAYAKNYLELYREIYPDRLKIEWNVDEQLLSADVPTYVLQPIVENSMVHGMEPKIGICTVCITVRKDGRNLLISVWDDGDGMEPEKLKQVLKDMKQSRRVGLRNVQDRIHILYGKDYGISIQSEFHRYTEVRIVLPLTRHPEERRKHVSGSDY